MNDQIKFFPLDRRCDMLAAIARATDLNALLDLLGKEIDQLPDTDGYIINLRDQTGEEVSSVKIHFPAEFRYLEKTYHGYKSSVNEEASNAHARALRNRSMVRINASEGLESDKQVLTRWKIEEFVIVPLINPNDSAEAPLGTLLLMRESGHIEDRAFAIFEELISIFFAPLRTALNTSFLGEFHHRFKAAAEEQARSLEFIIELNNLTASEKILDMFSSEIFHIMPFECIGYFLLEEDVLKNKMVSCAAPEFDLIKEEWSAYLSDKHYTLSNQDGGVSHAFTKNSSLMFQDVQQVLHVPMSEKDMETLRILKTPRTLLVLPIRYQHKPIGCITFFSLTKIVDVTEVDLRILDNLSAFLGTAIVNSNTFALSRAQNAELERLASHDVLTGLPNRALLMDRLHQGVSRWKRHNQKATIAFVDLDHFKNINDSLGHSTGDKALVTVAKNILGAIRQSDTVARFGGDEFVLILEDRAGVDSHTRVLERIASTLCEPMLDLPLEVAITCSVGYSRYPEDGEDVDTLLKAADAAMYLAKQLGRSNIQAYTADMRMQAIDRLSMESKLRYAVDRNQLILHYQPKVDLRTGRVVGMEALVRWDHPELGLVSPGVFIPIAEESGLIVPIGDWILRTACAQALAWKEAGTPIPVAVNLSARQFQQPNISSRVRFALESIGLDAKYLELELTESMSMDNPEKSIAIMQTFKALGITLTIDDFGTGYSNLSYLKRFPVDKLKLDQSFVRDMTQSSEILAISQAVLAVAHSLALKVVAEGVETEAQLNLLARNHCDEIQGFYFSKPLPAEQCIAFLREDRRISLKEIRQVGNSRTILIVDDQLSNLGLLGQTLSQSGYQILKARSASIALDMLAVDADIAVVLSDNVMPGMNGLDFLNHVKSMYPGIVRAMLSGYTDGDFLVDAINRNIVFRFIVKPWETESMLSIVAECCSEYERLATVSSQAMPPAASRRSH